MELMQVILHSDAIERFEKIYPELVKKNQFKSGAEAKQDYLKFLNDIRDLNILELSINILNMDLNYSYYREEEDKDRPEAIMYVYSVIEELIKEIIYDPRIDFGYCIQCGREYPIKTGCTHTTRIYGKCHPKNLIPYVDKEGKIVFKGGHYYKQSQDWDPDEYIPHSPEIMEKNRKHMRKQRACQEKWAKAYEACNEPEKAERARKNKIKVF